jgi:hypothetical protein
LPICRTRARSAGSFAVRLRWLLPCVVDCCLLRKPAAVTDSRSTNFCRGNLRWTSMASPVYARRAPRSTGCNDDLRRVLGHPRFSTADFRKMRLATLRHLRHRAFVAVFAREPCPGRFPLAPLTAAFESCGGPLWVSARRASDRADAWDASPWERRLQSPTVGGISGSDCAYAWNARRPCWEL